MLPSRLRQPFGVDVVLTALVDGCIGIHSREDFTAVAANALERRTDGPAGRRRAREFFASASEERIDRSGRVTIPGNLCEHADLNGRVVVLGCFDHIEVWSPDRWTRVQETTGGAEPPIPTA